jgi:hypothetical protein
MTDTSNDLIKLHQELLDAGLPVVSVSSDGRVDYSRELTTKEKAAAEKVIAAHDPTPSTSESRIQAYFDAGITLQDMVFALWSKIMQEDSTEADSIQAEMTQINATIN